MSQENILSGKQVRSIEASSQDWIGPLPSASLKVILGLYKYINNSGALHTKIGSLLFSSAYFAYKSLFGDNFKALVHKHPEYFTSGHIIDVGANIGYTAYLFNQVLNSPYKVFAFEPEEKNFVELKRNLKKMKMEKNVIPVQSALGESSGSSFLWYNPTSHAAHRIIEQNQIKLESDTKLQRVNMQSLDAFLEERHIQDEPVAFIKIDVQGYEGPVFKGMKKTLEKNPNVTVVFEYSPHTMKQLGFAPTELIQDLKEQGFTMQVLNRDGSLSAFDSKIENSGDFGEYFDILCKKAVH